MLQEAHRELQQQNYKALTQKLPVLVLLLH